MLIDASRAATIACSESVIGVNTIFDAVPVLAFSESHTPPPVVPIYRRFPVASAGSNAIAEMRPVTSP